MPPCVTPNPAAVGRARRGCAPSEFDLMVPTFAGTVERSENLHASIATKKVGERT